MRIQIATGMTANAFDMYIKVNPISGPNEFNGVLQ